MAELKVTDDAEARREVITRGLCSADRYEWVTISGEHNHVGPSFEGLNEEQTRDLLKSLLGQIESDGYDRSARDYFRSLRSYSGSPYRVIARPPDGFTLDDVYVPLSVALEDQAVSSANTQSSPSISMTEGIAKAFSIGSKQILVEGLPGSGKSTLLRQIVRHASETPERIGLDRRYLVLPISLLALSQSDGVSREERLWNAVRRARDLDIAEDPPKGFYTVWPQNLGLSWLLLFDGFDEVPEERSEEINDFLNRLVKSDERFIVTTRPTERLKMSSREAFRTLRIAPFSAEQQSLLAHRWLGELAPEFLERFATFAGDDLASTPLLLNIGIKVYSERHSLPTRRAQLYDQFIEILWKEAVSRGGSDELEKELLDIAPWCLRAIALSMTQAGTESGSPTFGGDSAALTETTTQALIHTLQISEGLAVSKAERVLGFLGRRSGVFQIVGDEGSWAHRTFREFLSAKALTFGPSARERTKAILPQYRLDQWRQVVLFCIGLLSERGSVSDIVAELAAMEPSHGAVLAATAIQEGAKVDSVVKALVIRKLCDGVRQSAAGNICARLLTNTGHEGAIPALLPFSGLSELRSQFDELKRDLTKLAYAFGGFYASALEDLVRLGASETLTRIAFDASAPLTVRVEAAIRLLTLRAAFDAPALLGELLDASRVQLGNGSGHLWVEFINRMIARNGSSETLTLIQNAHLPTLLQLIAQLATADSSEKILAVIRSADAQPEVIEMGLEALKNKQDHGLIAKLARTEHARRNVSSRAVQILRSLRATPELIELTECSELALLPRRRAAEAVYKAELTTALASSLLAFFDSLGASRSLTLLARKAYLNYYLGFHSRGVELFDRVLERNRVNPWAIASRAHCIEQLGKVDDAFAEYGVALEMLPSYTFARSRRAYIYWSKGQFAKGLSEIEKQYGERINENNAQDWFDTWFLPFGGDIMRECGRREQADRWLTAGVRRDSGSSIAFALRAIARFETGDFTGAISDLDASLGINPQYLWAQERLGEILSATGQLVRAEAVYDALLLRAPENARYLSSRAQICLRSGVVGKWKSDTCELLKRDHDKPWHQYLEGLSQQAQGNPDGFRSWIESARQRALEAPKDTHEYRSACALYSLALGTDKDALELAGSNMPKALIDDLRYHFIAQLDALASVVPTRDDIRRIRDAVFDCLWPDGVVTQAVSIRKRLISIPRGAYPCPMYCQLQHIGGLEKDNELADKILHQTTMKERAILLWSLDQPDKVYGQTNFKADRDAHYNFKFCESLETLLLSNIEIFVNSYGVKRLLFLEAELMSRIQRTVEESHLKVSCNLVQPPVDL